MFISGELDRQSDRKGIERGVKKIKASFKDEKKRTFAEKSKTDLVFEKWMYFGSGFYGLAALWTLVVIEVSELIGFVFNFPGFDVLFGDGLIAFLFNLAMNQLSNLVSAFCGSAIGMALCSSGYWLRTEVTLQVLKPRGVI